MASSYMSQEGFRLLDLTLKKGLRLDWGPFPTHLNTENLDARGAANIVLHFKYEKLEAK